MRIRESTAFLLLALTNVEAFVPKPTVRISTERFLQPPANDPNFLQVVERVGGVLTSGVENSIKGAVSGFHAPSLPSLAISVPDMPSSLPSLPLPVLPGLNPAFAVLINAVETLTESIDLLDNVLQILEWLEIKLPPLAPLLQPLENNPEIVLGIVALAFANLVWVLSRPSTTATSPYPNQRYDADAAREYFDPRVLQVLSRSLYIFAQSAKFGINLLLDKLGDKIVDNEEQRGRELATLLSKLGPTFIKVGQSLSIRTDLLSPAYIRGLETLQDQVPAFDTADAQRILEDEWRKPVSEVLQGGLSDKPVAAASLGQVYKATLKETGQPVAVKVQRPDITTQIALDMYLLRRIASVVKPLFNLNTDTVGTVDSWGDGFVDELDYLQEASNAEFFTTRIKDTPLKDVVFAPTVVGEWSTRSTLVTEWVDGERLDRSSSDDVTVVCSIAMNTYLTMLLELGLLHCDPHPGNLLRVKEDGRLCILDWGMVTRIDKQRQLTLIEHMAHLTSADYAEVPRDLLLLGFIPQEKADLIEDSGVVDVLADIYGAWTSGGGAAAINVPEVIAQLQDLTAQKGNLFQIPPYFAYIAKSFSVLEGIGLSNDPKYSIINECLPYVSQRLLTDKEKMGPALSTFIFGPKKADKDRIVEYRRVEQLIEGFGDYTTSTSGALLGKEELSRTELLQDTADQVIDLVFSVEETPLQKIMLEQTAKIASASGRITMAQILERSGSLPNGRSVLGTIVDPLGLFRTSPLVRPNDLDEKTVETTRRIVTLLQKQIEETSNPLFDLSNLSQAELSELASIVVQKLWSRRIGVVQTGSRFVRELLELTANKLEDGERDSRRLPPRNLLAPAVENEPEKKTQESLRLQGARALLSDLQSAANEKPAERLPEPVPAAFDAASAGD